MSTRFIAMDICHVKENIIAVQAFRVQRSLRAGGRVISK
jgi:hypothetical protein